MVFSSPFGATVAAPGRGEVVLSVLSPSIPALTTLTYKYPLKLLSRSPGFQPEQSVVGQNATQPVHLYLLTYGGGLLPGDHIDVSINLKPKARLVVTTPQGSTKIFKTPPEGRSKDDMAFVDDDMSRQTLKVDIGSEAGLCYLVDPSAPFKDSRYEQIQVFTLDASQTANRSSLCVLDWVTQGRSSRGENWDFKTWKGRNEVWTVDKTTGKRHLLLRDALILDNETARQPQDAEVNFKCGELLRERTNPHGVLGTLILYGPMFDQLGSFFMDTFSSQSRIGGRNWSATTASIDAGNEQNKVMWTSARVRAGFVLVKFGARHLEAAREWLGNMLRSEGSIAREFGEEALFCL